MKTLTLVSVMFLGLVLFSGCGQTEKIPLSPSKEIQVVASPQEEIQNDIVVEEKENTEWNTFSFEFFNFKYPSQLCTETMSCEDLQVIKNEETISITNASDNSALFTFYYLEGIDQQGAEKYLQDIYGTVNPITWTTQQKNPNVKIAHDFGGFDQISGGVISYSAYSEKFQTMVSFGYAPACLLDCNSDAEFLSSIEFDSVKVIESVLNPIAETPKTYFQIEELGLEFPIDPTVSSDITYKIVKQSDSSDSYAVISSKILLEKQTNGCVTGVNLLKNTGKASDNPEFMSAFPPKQFDTFFVTAVGPQEPCSNDENLLEYAEVEFEFVNAVMAGLKNVKTIE